MVGGGAHKRDGVVATATPRLLARQVHVDDRQLAQVADVVATKVRPAATATATGSPCSVMRLAASRVSASRIDTALMRGCVTTSVLPAGSTAMSPIGSQVTGSFPK
jgi:hypothetical protein